MKIDHPDMKISQYIYIFFNFTVQTISFSQFFISTRREAPYWALSSRSCISKNVDGRGATGGPFGPIRQNRHKRGANGALIVSVPCNDVIMFCLVKF